MIAIITKYTAEQAKNDRKGMINVKDNGSETFLGRCPHLDSLLEVDNLSNLETHSGKIGICDVRECMSARDHIVVEVLKNGIGK